MRVVVLAGCVSQPTAFDADRLDADFRGWPVRRGEFLSEGAFGRALRLVSGALRCAADENGHDVGTRLAVSSTELGLCYSDRMHISSLLGVVFPRQAVWSGIFRGRADGAMNAWTDATDFVRSPACGSAWNRPLVCRAAKRGSRRVGWLLSGQDRTDGVSDSRQTSVRRSTGRMSSAGVEGGRGATVVNSEGDGKREWLVGDVPAGGVDAAGRGEPALSPGLGGNQEEGWEREGRRAIRRRRVVLPIGLFFLTCLSTFFTGACQWWPPQYLFLERPLGNFDSPWRRAIYAHWDDGLVYMACVLAILLTHEMGHFIATLCYRVPASLPFFLPLPVSPIGTMGAVIAMDGRRANRRETFDIGLAGPLAGLVVAVPILLVGVMRLDLTVRPAGFFQLDLPLATRLILDWVRPAGYAPGMSIWQSQLNPYFMAGWIGLFITGLNMMPVSQLDGGHVIYTLFGRRSYWIARGFVLLAITAMLLGWVNNGLWLMVLVVMLFGTDHPPTHDDRVPLGWFRTVLGCLSLAIPVLCFAPQLFIVPD